MTTTGKEAWEEILKGSASYNMYKNFDEEAKFEKEEQEEENKLDRCKVFKDKYEKYKEAYNLCLRLGPSLKYLHDVVVGGTRRYSCIHYKYWMSYKLLNMFTEGSENEFDKSVLNEFLAKQNDFVKKYNDHGCKYDYENIDLNSLKEMNEKKYLHDYFRSYNTVKEYICRNPSKNGMYKEYLEHISELYKKYKGDCSDSFDYWTSSCPLYFKRGDEYDPKKLCAQFELESSNNDDVQYKQVKKDPVKSPKKKKMTFYYLKCNNKDSQGYRRCALIPTTMEYTENEDERKKNDKSEGKVTLVPPDPTIALGGILKKREQKTDLEVESGISDSTDDSQIDSSASSYDQSNSEYLTEADGISPYLVQTEDGIKWRIHDKETFDCNRYLSKDAYDLCIHLKGLHQEGKIKLNPNYRKVGSKKQSFEGGDGLSDERLYEMDEDDEYPSDIGNDMFSLLKTKQFRTGTTIALMLGTFFLGFAYYKYTPLGSFFRGKKGARRNIDHEYFERKSEELPRRSQQSVSKNRKKERIQIAYQQA
ncbi:VIR protein [Plasmodium vivax]|uniref:VIR protein n=1 Tax=Plasmodium vivax TaxID=5855 RepID=A0A1G4E4J6_PLAVI|nr:VIR protein [Plasmodium vivax]